MVRWWILSFPAVKFTGNNSGVQYRSEVFGDPDDLALRGYQADLHPQAGVFRHCSGGGAGGKLGKIIASAVKSGRKRGQENWSK